MKSSQKPQFTPRLPPYSGRYNYSDEATSFLPENQRGEIRIILQRHRFYRTRQRSRGGRGPGSSVTETGIERALDQVSNICWTYRDNGKHLRKTDIAKQRRSATAISKAASLLSKAMAQADPETRKRMFLGLAHEDDIAERIVKGWERYKRWEERVAQIEKLAVDAKKRAKKVYDSSARQKPLPFYASTLLHELVAVWCDLFCEAFQSSTSEAGPASTKKGIVTPVRLGGVDFVLSVLGQAGFNWDTDVVLRRLAKVREKRTATSEAESKKSASSDKGAHEVRRQPEMWK